MNIKEVDEIKFLGIIIDKHLSYSSHANKLLRYHKPAASLFYRLSVSTVLTLLYYSFIHSKLCYSIESWGNTVMVLWVMKLG